MKTLSLVTLILLTSLWLAGCSQVVRRLDLKDSTLVMENVNIYVYKSGVTETPSNTPELTIPLIPGL